MEFKDLQMGTWCLLDGQKAMVVERRELIGITQNVYVETFPMGLPAPLPDEDGLIDLHRAAVRHGPLLPEDLDPYQPPDYDEWLAHQQDERRALLPN